MPKARTPVDVHRDIGKVLNGNLEFGTPETFGTQQSVQNIRGWWWTGTSPSTPNTDFAVPHNLGVVPSGFDVKKKDKASHVYAGVTQWTSTAIYLRTDLPSVNLTLFVH